MNASLRICIFVGAFPVASETFILRQITGLLDLGHDVHIFANARAETDVVHEIVGQYGLMERTTFVEGPSSPRAGHPPYYSTRYASDTAKEAVLAQAKKVAHFFLAFGRAIIYVHLNTNRPA